jgi:hypothetical protein
MAGLVGKEWLQLRCLMKCLKEIVGKMFEETN